MSDVFLSYSRKDTKFVQEIFETLSARKREAWIDLHGIEYSAKWWEEICGGIDGADNFVLFVSPNSLESLFCHREIQHALKHNKRIIPFLFERIDQQAMFQAWQNNSDLCKFELLAHENWDSIQSIQWIDYTQIKDVNKAVDALLATVDTDPERVKLHTRLLLRLHDWESRGRNPSGLLRGDELTQYEQWFTESQQKETPPHPTAEQSAYIAESRRVQDESEAKRIQRERLIRRFKTASSVLSVFFILAVIATIVTIGFANNAVDAQKASIAREGEANTQVALSGVTLQAGSTRIADGSTQVAVIGNTLTPMPPTLTSVAQTVVAGSYMIESLNLSAQANRILRTEGGNAETAALLSIRVLRKIYLASADSALVEAISRMKSAPQVFQNAEMGFVTSVAFSPDGKTFLVSYNGRDDPNLGGAELRDTASGEVIWTRALQIPYFNSLAFSPDGQLIVAAGGDHTAMIWDAANGATIRVLKGHSDIVQSAIFSPNGKTVLTAGGGYDLTLRLWEFETGRQIYSVPGGPGYRNLFFFADGLTFFAGETFYNTSDGSVNQVTPIGGGNLAFSADGRTSVSGFSPTAKLIDVSSGQIIRTLPGHTNSVMSAAFSADGKWLVTGSRDNTVRVWEVASGKSQLLSGHTAWVESVAFSPDGTKVLTGSSDARLWSLTIENQPQQTISTAAGVATIALSPDGKTVLYGDVNGNSGLWDLDTGQLIFNFPKSDADISYVAFSPDGKLVAIPTCCSQGNGVVVLFDPSTGKLVKTFNADGSPQHINSLTFSSDSKMIFVSYMDSTAQLSDVASGQVLRLFDGQDPQEHGSASYSPDGNLVTLAGGSIWWDIAAGGEMDLPAEMKHSQTVFSADGSLAALLQYNHSVNVWNVSTQKLINGFFGHTDLVTSAAISLDNRLLLTGSSDKTARLWDISTGQLVRVFDGHSAAVTSVAFMPDGQRIITGSLDGTIRTWITDYYDLLAYACTRVAVDLTPEERSFYGVSGQEPTCPQFGLHSQPLMPTTTPMPTHPAMPAWTPIPTPTPSTTNP
ncbi:MAG: TIR domain-containing protein [Chloroflexi bacterium]|nr:MAG: TIR domain-containing protein [Chloroflexota bacterium]